MLITHDLGVAAQVADRVAVHVRRPPRRGRPDRGRPRRAVAPVHPRPAAVAAVADDRPHASRCRPCRAVRPTRRTCPAGCAFAPRCPLAHGRRARRRCPSRSRSGASQHLRACIAEPARVQDLRARQVAPVLPPDGRPGAGRRTAAGAAAHRRGREDVPRQAPAAAARRELSGAARVSPRRGREGESVAIVGESGSGKSTLLRVARRPRVARAAARSSSAPAAAPQMVFQDAGASLTPWLTVGELIDERLRTEGLPKAERRDARRSTALRAGRPARRGRARPGPGSSPAGSGSGSRWRGPPSCRPRCCSATSRPARSTSSLAASVLNLIGELRRELGMAVVFVTHDLSVARVVADRIAVMYLGRIVEIGDAGRGHPPPRAPVHAGAGRLRSPTSGVAPPALKGEPASPLSPPTGCAFHPRCPLAVDACSRRRLDVPLERLRVGADLLADADTRRVACIRPKERDRRWPSPRPFVPHRVRADPPSLATGPRRAPPAQPGWPSRCSSLVTLDRAGRAAARAARSADAGRHAAAAARHERLPARHRQRRPRHPQSACSTALRSSWFAALVVVAFGLLFGGLVGLVAGAPRRLGRHAC